MKSLKTKPKKIAEEDSEEIETYQEEFEVEKLLDVRIVKGEEFYKVKWKGYPLSQCTWEPIGHLTNCEKAIQLFEMPYKETDRLVLNSDRESEHSKNFEEQRSEVVKEKKKKKKKNNEISIDQNKKENNLAQRIGFPKNSSHLWGINSSEINIKQMESKKKFKKQNEQSTEDNSIRSDSQFDILVKSLEETTTEEGSIDIDIPIKVLDVTIKDPESRIYNCLVEWKTRQTGIKPKNSKLSTKIFKEKYGALLVDFYESRISFTKL